MDKEHAVVGYITHEDGPKAKSLSKKLVKANLVACVNILPSVTSVYLWKGNVDTSSEVLMIIKTMSSKTKEVIEFVKKNHPYDVPEVIFTKVVDGSKDYLKWVDSSTKVKKK